jgi:hypothetical protein
MLRFFSINHCIILDPDSEVEVIAPENTNKGTPALLRATNQKVNRGIL